MIFDRMRLWLRANIFRSRYEREMRDEMDAHLERATDLLVARGMSRDDAARAARREFGDVAYHQTEGRESRGTLWLDALLDDTRYGVRQLVRAPVFTLVASLSVAVGVIVAVGAFTLLNAIVFKPLPVPDGNAIYHVYTSDFDGRARPYGSSSYADYLDFTKAKPFASLAASAWRSAGVSLTRDGEPKNEYIGFVSPNYFSTLRLPLAHGRSIADDAPEIVITWQYFTRMFGGDVAALGSSIRINGSPVTIVGVAPASFHGVGMGPPLIGWVPATLVPMLLHEQDFVQDRGARWFTVFGRLRDGTSPAAASSALNAMAKGLAEQAPRQWRDTKNEVRVVTVLSHRDSVAPPGDRAELVMGIFAGGLLVLLIALLACTNVAALLLARAVGRDREITMRLALGASRMRLVRQLLTESLILGLVGGAISMVGLMWTTRIVEKRVPLADMVDLRADWRVILVALGVSVLCALVFGTAPVLHSLRIDLRGVLSGSAATPARNRMRGVLISLQVCASCVLIMLAVSAVRGVRKFAAINPGISLDGLVAIELDLDSFGDDTAREAGYSRRIRELIATEPGVVSAASTGMLPLGNGFSDGRLEIPGKPKSYSGMNVVGSDFFRTVRLSPLSGRVFDDSDTRIAEPVAVVNRQFLAEFGAGLVGTTVKVDDVDGVRIVGVVPDIAYLDPRAPQRSMIYVIDDQARRGASHERYLMRTTPGSENAVVQHFRTRVRSEFPDMVAPTIESMRARTARQTLPQRIAGRVAIGIGGVELLLAAVGLYGLLMFALLAHTRELGVRLALGASGAQASWAIMQSGLRWALWGAGAGLLIAVPAAFVAESALPGAQASDPVPFVLALLCVTVASGIAAIAPARKAARVEPASVLRYD